MASGSPPTRPFPSAIRRRVPKWRPSRTSALRTRPAPSTPPPAPAAPRPTAAASRARPAWSARTAKEGASILKRWFDLITAETENLAQLMTTEQGKPLAEERAEGAYGASFIEWFAEEGKRAYGRTIPTTVASKRYLTIKQPIGVVAAVAPWNFPIAMITRKVAPALAS